MFYILDISSTRLLSFGFVPVIALIALYNCLRDLLLMTNAISDCQKNWITTTETFILDVKDIGLQF